MIVSKFNRNKRNRHELHGPCSQSVDAYAVTTKMVVDCAKRNPRWSSGDIARCLGCTRKAVIEMAARAGVILPGANFGNRERGHGI